jgi:hypothetical protein
MRVLGSLVHILLLLLFQSSYRLPTAGRREFYETPKEVGLTLQSPVVTVCTTHFNIVKLYVPPRVYLCVSYGKGKVFPSTGLGGP